MAFTPPETTEKDAYAARLLVDLARVDRQAAIDKLTPLVAAARIWTEENPEGSTHES